MYRLDRSAFKVQTFEESDDDVAFWKALTTDEIFDFAWYLTCQTYKINTTAELSLDRTFFEMKKNG